MLNQTLFSDFRRSLDQLFENFYGSNRLIGSEGNSDWTFAPVVETGWNDNYLNLRVVVPGVAEKDIKATLQGNQLVIEGERKAPEGFTSDGYGHTRLPYGRFHTTVDLPNGLELEKMSCHLHDGVLDIRIPVATAMKPRQIQIKSGEPRKAIAA